jgi:stage III sporulation protein AE
MKIKILLLLIIICIQTISLAQTETIEQSEILESQQETLNISSEQSEILESQQETLNISSFIEEAKKYSANVYKDIDFNELFNLAITGNINNKTIINNILKILGKEIVGSVAVIGSIILIIIIHSIFKSLSEGLENKTISQITYYIQYILIVTLIMTNFSNILIMIKESIQNLVGFMNNLIPILITLMLTTGNIVSANLMQPIILFIITFIGNFITTIIIPLVLIATALGIISKISDKIQIDKLSKFLKSSVVWILGVILTIFVGLISVEGSLSSSVDGITAKTTKAAVSSFIPVVGKILRRCSRYSNRL